MECLLTRTASSVGGRQELHGRQQVRMTLVGRRCHHPGRVALIAVQLLGSLALKHGSEHCSANSRLHATHTQGVVPVALEGSSPSGAGRMAVRRFGYSGTV